MKKLLILFLILTASASAQYPMVAGWNDVAVAPPANRDSLDFWAEADYPGETRADGDTIYIWKAREGYVPHASRLTDAQKPVYRDSAGIAWYQFDGTDDLLRGSIVPTASSNYTMFVVSKANVATDTRIVYGSGGGNGAAMLFYNSKYSIVHQGIAIKQGAASSTLASLWGFAHDTYTTAYLNSDTTAITFKESLQTPATATYHIGNNSTGGNPWNGNIYAIVHFSRRLPVAEIQQWITYLQAKYGAILP